MTMFTPRDPNSDITKPAIRGGWYVLLYYYYKEGFSLETMVRSHLPIKWPWGLQIC